ncbi:hypothetical protein HaLaN_33054, partial [Haematococcus lacustris]
LRAPHCQQAPPGRPTW